MAKTLQVCACLTEKGPACCPLRPRHQLPVFPQLHSVSATSCQLCAPNPVTHFKFVFRVECSPWHKHFSWDTDKARELFPLTWRKILFSASDVVKTTAMLFDLLWLTLVTSYLAARRSLGLLYLRHHVLSDGVTFGYLVMKFLQVVQCTQSVLRAHWVKMRRLNTFEVVKFSFTLLTSFQNQSASAELKHTTFPVSDTNLI